MVLIFVLSHEGDDNGVHDEGEAALAEVADGGEGEPLNIGHDDLSVGCCVDELVEDVECEDEDGEGAVFCEFDEEGDVFEGD